LYWVACIQELGATAFVLLAAWMLGWKGARAGWAIAAFAAAMLCKESVLATPLPLALVYGRRVWRYCGAMLGVGIAIFVASGLHQRMFASDASLPYATSYGANLFVHLATQLFWFFGVWRAYPDRISGPDTAGVWPAAGSRGGFSLLAGRWGPLSLRGAGLALAGCMGALWRALPLSQHAYAYSMSLPQIGFVILFGVAAERLVSRWSGEVVRA